MDNFFRYIPDDPRVLPKMPPDPYITEAQYEIAEAESEKAAKEQAGGLFWLFVAAVAGLTFWACVVWAIVWGVRHLL